VGSGVGEVVGVGDGAKVEVAPGEGESVGGDSPENDVQAARVKMSRIREILRFMGISLCNTSVNILLESA